MVTTFDKKKEKQFQQDLAAKNPAYASSLANAELAKSYAASLQQHTTKDSTDASGGTPAGKRNTFQVDNKVVTPEEYKNKVEQAQIVNEQGGHQVISAAQIADRMAQSQQIGQTQPVMTDPLSNPAYGSALSAGLGQAAIGAAGGAGVGAIGGPVGAGIGAATGAIGGFIHGFTGKLKEEQRQGIQADFVTFQRSRQNFRMLINDVNQGGDPIEDLQLFNDQLAAIDSAHSKIFLESQRNLNKFLSIDAQVELAKFEDFYTFTRPQLIREMQQAMLNPNPNKVLLTPEDYQLQEQ